MTDRGAFGVYPKRVRYIADAATKMHPMEICQTCFRECFDVIGVQPCEGPLSQSNRASAGHLPRRFQMPVRESPVWIFDRAWGRDRTAFACGRNCIYDVNDGRG